LGLSGKLGSKKQGFLRGINTALGKNLGGYTFLAQRNFGRDFFKKGGPKKGVGHTFSPLGGLNPLLMGGGIGAPEVI